ncbi:hypothetical protein BDW67DRAFT_123339 [Aspergillus spinulosporus]
MLSQPTATLFSLLALTLPATVTAQAQRLNNCTVFNWDGNNPYLTTYPPQRVSGASSCPETSSNLTCALSASGDAQYPALLNITNLAPGDFASVVMETVRSTTLAAPGFNDSVIGSIDATRILASGQSAYLNFTAYKFCYAGTVENCTADGVENGTAIEACAPVWHKEGGSVRLDGEYKVVNVSVQDVGRYEDPYANQVGGDAEDAALGLKERMNVGLAVLAGLVVLIVV